MEDSTPGVDGLAGLVGLVVFAAMAVLGVMLYFSFYVLPKGVDSLYRKYQEKRRLAEIENLHSLETLHLQTTVVDIYPDDLALEDASTDQIQPLEPTGIKTTMDHSGWVASKEGNLVRKP